ncbi:hypothetical protein [Acaryochloris marina]|uniref:Uncharacterized protein n=1 Tax=Acaryochloris marina (strain MBIC 11017) TaxID=329726 RepID=A8ZNE1_ACAM1|nr:hypothetical protein [Acaryochloris marina]ABW32527.1 hypothetical protein AM1_D0030 [Acaryochloris marina MBIC11017]
MYKHIPHAIPIALCLAAVPGIAQAQDFPTIEVAPRHGHTFYFKNEEAVVVEAWPGAFDAFDFGERPKIPSARFIFVNLKPKGNIDSTTLTVVYRVGTKEKTKTFLLKKTKGIPSRFSTAIDGAPPLAAQPQPVQPITVTNVFTPPPKPVKQIHKEKKAKKPRKLKVSKEFSSPFSSGFASSNSVAQPPASKETQQPEPEETEETDVPDSVEPKTEEKAETPQSEPLPLIRAPKTLQAKATIETPTEKQLIARSSLDNFGIARYLLRGLYQAERLNQINTHTPQFGQAQDTAIWLRRGRSIEEALELSGLPPVTFNNLLGHGGVGK